MKTKLLRLRRADMDRHKSMPDIDDMPLFYWYDEWSGQIEIWPPDRSEKYKIHLTVEEK